MKNLLNKIKYIPLVLVALILALLPLSVVFAIDPPSGTITLAVNAYQDCLEDDDMFFLGYYNVPYTTYPTDYTINESFLFRLLGSGGAELYSTSPFSNPYFHLGYGRGIVSMYFSAADVSTYGLIWGDNYSGEFSPNPIVTWNGTAPTAASGLVTWSGTGYAARVLYLMSELQAQWVVSLVDSGTLSAYGANYGIGAIPKLRELAPDIFQSYIEPATEFRERTFTLTYATTLRNQWVGTWLDMTDVAADWGVDKVWIYGLLWLPVLVGVGWVTIYLNGRQEQARDTKPLFYVEALTIFFGGLIGFLPWLATVLVAVILAFMIINQIWFSKSY